MKALISCAALAVLAPLAHAQIAFSIDWHGPTVGQPDPITMVPITEGDILVPQAGPAFNAPTPPRVAITGGQLSLVRYPICVGHPPGTPCGVELDALSFGDEPYYPSSSLAFGLEPTARIWFSLDEYAVGLLPVPSPAPNVQSEAPSGDSSADVFSELDLGQPPLDIPVVPDGHVGVLDGNGLPSASGLYYRGLGLVEPNPPGMVMPNPGDNVDALNIGPLPEGPGLRVYFSLDAAFFDVKAGVPNSGSANGQGVLPGAILRKVLGPGTPTVWATPNQLGLDRHGPPGSDDLDALILAENGNGVFQPSLFPFDWEGTALGPAPTDMVLFSVRRGSAVIGQPDSLFGRPIEPGDILIPPIAGGLSPFPGIFVAAENLGLATSRSGQVALGDDIDALALSRVPCFDCNNNGIEDAVDIANGTSGDVNGNGIPDECERAFSSYCYCADPLDPCGNDDPGAGCDNSTGVGAKLEALTGSSTSVAADDLVLTSTQLPTATIGIYFMGLNPASSAFGDGLLCVGAPTYRLGAVSTAPSGIANRGPGLVAYTCAVLPPAACLSPGVTWRFQFWYRNVLGPCGFHFNTTNGLAVSFTP